MNEAFPTKYTGEHGEFKFGVLATGSTCEMGSWKTTTRLKFEPGDTVTFNRNGTKINVQINGEYSDYYYDILTTGDLYLSCSCYALNDEFEIIE